jgi:hypothetical protein
VSGVTSFDGATFEARLQEAKHLPSGEMRIVLLIPENDKEAGKRMADAFSCGLVVEVTKKTHGT